jgi:hypothetical protein
MATKVNYTEAKNDSVYRQTLVIKVSGRKGAWIECEGYDGVYFEDEMPDGKYAYYCRHKEMNLSQMVSIKKNRNLTVNFWGTIVTDEPIDFGKEDEVEVSRVIDITDDHDAVMVFGESAADAYLCEGFAAMKRVIENGDGQLLVRRFNTNDERCAYLQGLEDQVGWGGSTPLFPADVYKHYKAIEKML